jgi:hypothetical protein
VKQESLTITNSGGTSQTWSITGIPTWLQVTPSSDNMNMIAVVKNGSETLSGVEVGAFVGTECRGAQASNANNRVFLTIAGETNGQTVSFKVHKPNGETVDVTQTIAYQNDALLGTIADPYVIQLSPTGLEDINVLNMNIYPNPVSEKLFIAGAGPIDRMEALDLSGRILLINETVLDNSLDVSSLSDGVYMLRVTVGKQTKMFKFTKK